MVAVARRNVLIGGSVGVGLMVAGCTVGTPSRPAPTSPPAPDPLLAELADERTLIAAYDATMARYPALRARLSSVRDDHAAHAAALLTALGRAASRTSSPDSPDSPDSPEGTPSPTGARSGAPSGSPVARTAGAAVAALRAAERSAASARGTVALTAPADRARLLAGISASEASHVAVLP